MIQISKILKQVPIFRMLGKESIDEHHFGHYDLEVEVQNQLFEMAPLFAKQDASYNLDVKGTVTVYAPESFITIVLNNLIKNAFSYSVGDVGIVVTGYQLVITNRHDGNETYNAGYGCGLVIVQRICERMGWSFETQDDGLQFSTYLDFSANNQVG